jgi:hypothetical protein
VVPRAPRHDTCRVRGRLNPGTPTREPFEG